MAKPEHDYYATLGVDRDADASTIKKKYHEKARDAHPDKGGNEGEMADLNAAYECLSNPTRRLLYDQTGTDDSQTLEQEVQNLLMNEFATALNTDATDILYVVRRSLTTHKQGIIAKRQQTIAAQKKFERQRDRVKTKGNATNLYHLVIDKQLLTVKAGLFLLDRQEQLIDAALKELEFYESEDVIPRYTLPSYVIINSFSDPSRTYD